MRFLLVFIVLTGILMIILIQRYDADEPQEDENTSDPDSDDFPPEK